MLDQNRIILTQARNFNKNELLEIYKLNGWSAAKKPKQLIQALKNSHTLILAYYESKLIGLGNALSDGYLAVYYSHMLVHPDFQGQGIGTLIMQKMQDIYGDFHQQVLIADGKAIDFYKKFGFERAGDTEPMWIFQGDEH